MEAIRGIQEMFSIFAKTGTSKSTGKVGAGKVAPLAKFKCNACSSATDEQRSLRRDSAVFEWQRVTALWPLLSIKGWMAEINKISTQYTVFSESFSEPRLPHGSQVVGGRPGRIKELSTWNGQIG